MRLIFRILGLVFSLLAISEPSIAQLSGGGGATQVAGSFSPQVFFGAGNCTAAGTPCTFSSGPTGNYIKTGSVVFVEIGFTFTNPGNGAGAITIRNLPFTSQNLGTDAFGCIGIYQALQAATDAFYFQAGIAPNSTVILIRYRSSGNETDMLNTHLSATSYIKMTCQYPA